MMKKLEISADFTIEDIHKIREYNYEVTKDMAFEEQRAYYKKGSDEMMRRIEEIRRNNKRPTA